MDACAVAKQKIILSWPYNTIFMFLQTVRRVSQNTWNNNYRNGGIAFKTQNAERKLKLASQKNR